LLSARYFEACAAMATRFQGDMTPINSSAIEAIGYDNNRRALAVRFKGGSLHLFSGVSRDEHAALMGAESIGSHFAKRNISDAAGRAQGSIQSVQA
jgi:hypothetical protein